jgi:hypothetical protein
MKGQQPPQPSLFACVRLEEMIPPDHLLRRIQQAIDFTFIDRLTEPLFKGSALYNLQNRPPFVFFVSTSLNSWSLRIRPHQLRERRHQLLIGGGHLGDKL